MYFGTKHFWKRLHFDNGLQTSPNTWQRYLRHQFWFVFALCGGKCIFKQSGKTFFLPKNFLCVRKICFICNEYHFVSHKLHQNIGIQYPNLNILPVYIHGQKGEMLTVLKLLFHLFWPWLYVKDSNCHPPSLLFCLLNFVAKYFLATQLSLFPWTIL